VAIQQVILTKVNFSFSFRSFRACVLTGGWGKIGAVTVAVIAEGNGWSLNGDGCLGCLGGIDLDE